MELIAREFAMTTERAERAFDELDFEDDEDRNEFVRGLFEVDGPNGLIVAITQPYPPEFEVESAVAGPGGDANRNKPKIRSFLTLDEALIHMAAEARG